MINRSLDAILAAGQGSLRSAGTDTSASIYRRAMDASRDVRKLDIPAGFGIEDIPTILSALAGRTVTKWLISPAYLNLIPRKIQALDTIATRPF